MLRDYEIHIFLF